MSQMTNPGDQVMHWHIILGEDLGQSRYNLTLELTEVQGTHELALEILERMGSSSQHLSGPL
jgi:hypothetical protein